MTGRQKLHGADITYQPQGMDGRPCIILRFRVADFANEYRMTLEDAESLGQGLVDIVRAAEVISSAHKGPTGGRHQ